MKQIKETSIKKDSYLKGIPNKYNINNYKSTERYPRTIDESVNNRVNVKFNINDKYKNQITSDIKIFIDSDVEYDSSQVLAYEVNKFTIYHKEFGSVSMTGKICLGNFNPYEIFYINSEFVKVDPKFYHFYRENYRSNDEYKHNLFEISLIVNSFNETRFISDALKNKIVGKIAEEDFILNQIDKNIIEVSKNGMIFEIFDLKKILNSVIESSSSLINNKIKIKNEENFNSMNFQNQLINNSNLKSLNNNANLNVNINQSVDSKSINSNIEKLRYYNDNNHEEDRIKNLFYEIGYKEVLNFDFINENFTHEISKKYVEDDMKLMINQKVGDNLNKFQNTNKILKIGNIHGNKEKIELKRFNKYQNIQSPRDYVQSTLINFLTLFTEENLSEKYNKNIDIGSSIKKVNKSMTSMDVEIISNKDINIDIFSNSFEIDSKNNRQKLKELLQTYFEKTDQIFFNRKEIINERNMLTLFSYLFLPISNSSNANQVDEKKLRKIRIKLLLKWLYNSNLEEIELNSKFNESNTKDDLLHYFLTCNEEEFRKKSLKYNLSDLSFTSDYYGEYNKEFSENQTKMTNIINNIVYKNDYKLLLNMPNLKYSLNWKQLLILNLKYHLEKFNIEDFKKLAKLLNVNLIDINFSLIDFFMTNSINSLKKIYKYKYDNNVSFPTQNCFFLFTCFEYIELEYKEEIMNQIKE